MVRQVMFEGVEGLRYAHTDSHLNFSRLAIFWACDGEEQMDSRMHCHCSLRHT